MRSTLLWTVTIEWERSGLHYMDRMLEHHRGVAYAEHCLGLRVFVGARGIVVDMMFVWEIDCDQSPNH